MTARPLRPDDEGRHPAPGAEPDWQETWWFDAWTPDGSLAVCTWLTLLPDRQRAWYWCHVVRGDDPVIHVVDLQGRIPAHGLLAKWEGMWADHECEAPFEQWTVRNETYGVALDDPDEALRRSYGDAVPVACDLEWYATSPPAGWPVPEGYTQDGEVHGVIELAGGAVVLGGRCRRGHVWGVHDWSIPGGDEPAQGRRAPVRLRDLPGGDVVVEQVATGDGWRRWWHPA